MFHLAELPTYQRYECLLVLANRALWVFLMSFIGTIFLAYSPTVDLPVSVQVIVHILLLLSAFAIKVAYIARCVAQKALGLEVR